MRSRLEAMLNVLTKNVRAHNDELTRAAQEADNENWRSEIGKEGNRRGRASEKRAKSLLKCFNEIVYVRRATTREDRFESIDLWAECRIPGKKNRVKKVDVPVQVKSSDENVDASLEIFLARGQPRVTINAAEEVEDMHVILDIELQFLSMFQIKLTRREDQPKRLQRDR